MRYQCRVIINASLEKVISLFLKNMVMNEEKTSGSQMTFAQDIGNGQVVSMKETIESMNLPHEIVTIYEIEGVWNRCVNRFDEDGDKVIFTMDSQFDFEVEMDTDEEHFRTTTQRQMEDFKAAVETSQNS